MSSRLKIFNRFHLLYLLNLLLLEWSGLKKDMRSDLTVNLQEAFINLGTQVRICQSVLFGAFVYQPFTLHEQKII